MLTPYDWQEGIGNRAQYIDRKLAQGSPVLAVSATDGILMVTFRRQSRKLYEIYDRLAFAGIGQGSDIESIRLAALDFASREGYQRSEQDVTIQRVVTAMSMPLKKAFGDFSSSPFVARCLFAEVGNEPADDAFYVLDYTGDYGLTRKFAAIAGTDAANETLSRRLEGLNLDSASADLQPQLEEIWREAIIEEGGEEIPGKELVPEALLLLRSGDREDRFRLLTASY